MGGSEKSSKKNDTERNTRQQILKHGNSPIFSSDNAYLRRYCIALHEDNREITHSKENQRNYNKTIKQFINKEEKKRNVYFC